MTPEMWESHLQHNDERIVTCINKGIKNALPSVAYILRNPQYVTAKAAMALVEIQKGCKYPIPLFALFSHFFSFSENKKLADKLKSKTWGTWLQILATKHEIEFFKYLWEDSFAENITLYIDWCDTNWGLSPFDEYFVTNVLQFQNTKANIRFWATEETFPSIDKQIIEKGILPLIRNGNIETVWDEVEFKNGVWQPQEKKMIARMLVGYDNLQILNQI